MTRHESTQKMDITTRNDNCAGNCALTDEILRLHAAKQRAELAGFFRLAQSLNVLIDTLIQEKKAKATT